MGTMFCQYETPCGWCTRLNIECPKKGGCKPRKKQSAKMASDNADEKLLNPAGEYAVKFAENHGISVAEAMERPMVKARFEVF